MFYSAFEQTQADLIIASLSLPLRLIGIHHWLYRRFFSCLHRGLLCFFYCSAIILLLQIFLHGTFFFIISAIYAISLLLFIAYFQKSRAMCRDGHRHIPYNQFAPLYEKQRRELAVQRNSMEVSELISHVNLTGKAASSESFSENHLKEARFQKF